MIDYVYALANPETGEVHYVGVTRDPYRRLQQHRSGRGTNSELTNWIKFLHQYHYAPQMIILQKVSDHSRRGLCESRWIQIFIDKGAYLFNFQHHRSY